MASQSSPLALLLRSKWAILALFLLTFAVAAARTVWFRPHVDLYDAGHVSTPCIYVPENLEHWARPNCTGISRIGTQEAEMHFNSEGLRDKDYSAKAPKGVYRILLLGSSNTLGPGIAETDTFPRQLEAQLRKAGRNVEVINAAMVGYCTIQSTFRFQQLMKKYSPDLVAYQFVQGTCPLFDGAWADSVEYQGLTPLRIDRTPFSRTFAGLNNFLFAHQKLFFLWLSAADQLRKIRFSHTYSGSSDANERVAEYLKPTERFLAFLRDTARVAGAGFLIVSYKMKPATQSIPAQMSPLVARVLSPFIIPPDFKQGQIFAHLRSQGFGVFQAQFDSWDYLVGGDVHLSEAGLQLLARETATELLPRIPGRH